MIRKGPPKEEPDGTAPEARALSSWPHDKLSEYDPAKDVADGRWDVEVTVIEPQQSPLADHLEMGAERERDKAEARLRTLLTNEINAMRRALEERECDMHARIRAGYDATIADCWRAKVAEAEAERDAAVARALDLGKSLDKALDLMAGIEHYGFEDADADRLIAALCDERDEARKTAVELHDAIMERRPPGATAFLNAKMWGPIPKVDIEPEGPEEPEEPEDFFGALEEDAWEPW